MSILSDILSKIKHLEPKRDVPPGLRSTVATFKKKESNKKRLLFLLAFFVIALSSGFFTVYLIETYLTGDLKQGAEYKQSTGYIAKSLDNRSGQDDQHYAKNLEAQIPNQEKPSLKDNAVQTTKEISGEQTIIDSQKKRAETVEAHQLEGKEKSEENILQKRKTEKKARPEPANSQKAFAEADQRIQDKKTLPPMEDKVNNGKLIPDSTEKDLYLYMARNYENKKDFPNALASYKKVLVIEPKNYRVMNNIASILLQLNSFEEAKTYSQAALDVKNDYVPSLINIGIALARLGITEGAESSFLRALTLEPDNRHALLNIGILYEKKDNYKKAREYYLKLQRLGDIQGSIGLERTNAEGRDK